jgi:hypothetical protein
MRVIVIISLLKIWDSSSNECILRQRTLTPGLLRAVWLSEYSGMYMCMYTYVSGVAGVGVV